MLYPEIEKIIQTLPAHDLSDERKKVLQSLVDYIQSKVTEKKEIRLNFICTHNSRRSHLSQVWAQALAHYFELPMVFSYSGGTEATALFPMAAQTLQKCGFQIKNLSEGQNPVYSINYAENEHPVIGFSKTYDASFNPKKDFAAIMTCSTADAGCPFISGAEKRIPITFEDPKAFDNTPLQEEKYYERSIQIAGELYAVFSQIKR